MLQMGFEPTNMFATTATIVAVVVAALTGIKFNNITEAAIAWFR